MKTMSRIVLGVVVIGSIGGLVVAAGAQRSPERKAKTVMGDGLYAALQTSVPQVVLHHAVFGHSVQIASAEPTGLDAGGSPSRVPVVLRYASPGVVIGTDYRATRVDVADPVSVGDLIVGGVVENAGASAVLLMYSGGGEVRLSPGERVYIGAKARILEPPGAEGGVAMSQAESGLVLTQDGFLLGGVAGEGGPEPIFKPSHCVECSCECKGTGCSCSITIAAPTSTQNCNNTDNTACKCTGGACIGRTSGCFTIFVPCAE